MYVFQFKYQKKNPGANPVPEGIIEADGLDSDCVRLYYRIH